MSELQRVLSGGSGCGVRLPLVLLCVCRPPSHRFQLTNDSRTADHATETRDGVIKHDGAAALHQTRFAIDDSVGVLTSAMVFRVAASSTHWRAHPAASFDVTVVGTTGLDEQEVPARVHPEEQVPGNVLFKCQWVCGSGLGLAALMPSARGIPTAHSGVAQRRARQ